MPLLIFVIAKKFTFQKNFLKPIYVGMLLVMGPWVKRVF